MKHLKTILLLALTLDFTAFATDSAGIKASIARTVTVDNNPSPQLKSLHLSVPQTHFVQSSDSDGEGYRFITSPVKVMGLYDDGYSEEVTDHVTWNKTAKTVRFRDNELQAIEGNVTFSASLHGVSSNEVSIQVSKEAEKEIVYAVKITNNNQNRYKDRGSFIDIKLYKKPTSDVKLTLHLDPKENLSFHEYKKVYTKEIPFDTKRWTGNFNEGHDRDYVGSGVVVYGDEENLTTPYVVTTENLVSDDPYYDGMEIEDIVIKPLQGVTLIQPSLRQRRGAIRGIKIVFRVLSHEIGLQYKLINPPQGMRILGRADLGMTNEIDGVDIEWNVPMDIEEKTYDITIEATAGQNKKGSITFPIKVPKTTPIQTEVINNELIVTQKNSPLFGMKMKGHKGEDISNMKLRSVGYEDVWKYNAKPLDTTKPIVYTVFVVDNMPKALDVKLPEYMNTFEKRIAFGAGFERYVADLLGGDYWHMSFFGDETYDYEGTNGVIFYNTFIHNRKQENNCAQVFVFTTNEAL